MNELFQDKKLKSTLVDCAKTPQINVARTAATAKWIFILDKILKINNSLSITMLIFLYSTKPNHKIIIPFPILSKILHPLCKIFVQSYPLDPICFELKKGCAIILNLISMWEVSKHN